MESERNIAGAESLIGAVLGRRYRLEALLGAGGMGEVYRARDEVLRRPVAIKVIRRDLVQDPLTAARFRREARTASQVQHPHIVSIFEFGQSEQRPYIAMEYVEGPTLGALLARTKPFPVARALMILHQVATALDAAHRCRVVHRDLKPANIVLTAHGAEPDYVKILDFGLAKMVGVEATTQLTAVGETFGTPEYMSPEQCTDSAIDHRSDIYSLGVMAFELLVGEVPFTGRMVQVLNGHVREPPPKPSQAADRDDIAPAIDELVLRCLRKRPEERYESAEALATAIISLRRGRGAGGPAEPRDPQGQRSALQPASTLPVLLDPTAEVDGHATAGTIAVAPLTPEAAPTGPADKSHTQSLAELTYALRDRGWGSPYLISELALLLQSDDRLVEMQLELEQLQRELAENEALGHRREVQLSLLLAQLQHELTGRDSTHGQQRSEPGSGAVAGGTVDLAGRARDVARHMEQIAALRSERAGALVQAIAERQALVADLHRDVDRRAEQLEELLRLYRPDPASDPEVDRLFAAAGL